MAPPPYVAKYELGERRLDVLEFQDLAAVIGFDSAGVIELLLVPGLFQPDLGPTGGPLG